MVLLSLRYFCENGLHLDVAPQVPGFSDEKVMSVSRNTREAFGEVLLALKISHIK